MGGYLGKVEDTDLENADSDEPVFLDLEGEGNFTLEERTSLRDLYTRFPELEQYLEDTMHENILLPDILRDVYIEGKIINKRLVGFPLLISLGGHEFSIPFNDEGKYHGNLSYRNKSYQLTVSFYRGVEVDRRFEFHPK
ncbi:MAG: hypothetical protein ACYCQJ_15560 [Nitrososphaerales archaeon]